MVFIFQLVCLLFLALAPAASQAADPATFKPQVGIGTDFQAGTSYTPDRSTAMIGKYIRAIYKYAIGIVGILAAVVLMIGGVIWITAGGNAERIGEAKAWIASSLTGLLLALLSYTILATVNPALVNFQVTPVMQVTPTKNTITTQGCCVPVDKNSKACRPGSINDAGISLCLGGGEEKHDTKNPCNKIAQCEQFGTTCDGTNDGIWCDEAKTKACFNGRCEKCAQKGEGCKMYSSSIFCCPGLSCKGWIPAFTGDCE